ncbi:hypothetical protein O1M54_24005 [Streptomyces diastatochromogenes]|nr:hypothetical protein [Streptomyces diastatochromogenes]
MPPTHDVLPAGHDFTAYARTHWSRLVVTARLLTDDPGAAEELARRTLVRMCARWRLVPRNDVDFHVRRCLVRGHLRRLRGRRAARRRAVLVLRVWEGSRRRRSRNCWGVRRAQCGPMPGRAEGSRCRCRTAARGVRPRRRGPGPVRGAAGRRPGAGTRTAAAAYRRDRGRLRGAAHAGRRPGRQTAAGRWFGEEVSGAGAPAETSPVRVVAPGERVTAGPGVRVWLTADGGHWSVPVALAGDDGDRPRGEPGVSLRVDSVKGGFFLSGLFHGLSGEPGRVEVRTGDGETTAKVLVLAGSPGWGIWYASAPVSQKDVKSVLSAEGNERVVTLYDAAGKVAARSAREWWRI